jgi:putative restriction endonuclease
MRTMDPEIRDRQVRLLAFQFLAEQTVLHGDTLPWAVLSEQIEFEEQRVPLIGPQGIFKPAVLPEMPLSIATTPVAPGKERPYDDGIAEGLLLYRYRGTEA